MEEVLGPGYAHSWARDVVLPDLGVSAQGAIDAGIDTKDIWRAVCNTVEVPSTLT